MRWLEARGKITERDFPAYQFFGNMMSDGETWGVD